MTLNSVACHIRSVRVREISQKSVVVEKRRVCNFLIFQGTERINLASYNDRITMDEFGTLHIKDVTQDDNAKYICRAENGYGFVTGSSWLKVRRRSRIVVPPKHALYTVKTSNFP